MGKVHEPAATAAVLLPVTGGLLAHNDAPRRAPAEAKARKNPVAATPESVQAGAKLFQRNCVVCHGENGDGKGPWHHILTAPPGNFTDTRVMSEHIDGELFWKISTGREEMPAFGKRLSEQKLWHLVNYLRALAWTKSKK